MSVNFIFAIVIYRQILFSQSNYLKVFIKKVGPKVQYDGIIAMDSKILVDMLTIFGDVDVTGIRFSAQMDQRCDCPQVIYTLFDLVDRPVGYVKENRKGILGDLMYKTIL